MTKTAVVGVILVFCLSPVSYAESNRLTVTKLAMQSDGHRIRIDRYKKSQTAKQSAILVLHGAGGTVWDGPEMRRIARQLAESGHVVYLLHYFNQTGTVFGFDAGMQKNFEAWLGTVRDSIKFVQEDNASNSPIGIYGYSLGGFLALAAASDNSRVGAVVEQSGGIWNLKTNRIKHMPPVMIVHGEEDGRVPFQKYARPLVTILRERGAIVRTRFFPGEGHRFSALAMSKVRAAAGEFFHEHLVKKDSNR